MSTVSLLSSPERVFFLIYKSHLHKLYNTKSTRATRECFDFKLETVPLFLRGQGFFTKVLLLFPVIY